MLLALACGLLAALTVVHLFWPRRWERLVGWLVALRSRLGGWRCSLALLIGLLPSVIIFLTTLGWLITTPALRLAAWLAAYIFSPKQIGMLVSLGMAEYALTLWSTVADVPPLLERLLVERERLQACLHARLAALVQDAHTSALLAAKILGKSGLYGLCR